MKACQYHHSCEYFDPSRNHCEFKEQQKCALHLIKLVLGEHHIPKRLKPDQLKESRKILETYLLSQTDHSFLKEFCIPKQLKTILNTQ